MNLIALGLVSLVAVKLPTYHLLHEQVFGVGRNEMNRSVLAAVDKVQATAPDGGGYFTGIKAVPAESPIGCPVSLFGKPLLNPPRGTSYCSGASYSALIGALDSLLYERSSELGADRLEAIRMQEPNGGRREDMVKMWGWWNVDGPGCLFALTKFTNLGIRVGATEAEPGDFCNINWKSGAGHSVVFLDWETTPEGEPMMRYWSSQKGTNGLGDQTSPLASMSGVVFTRLTRPEGIFEFDPSRKMEKVKIEYESPRFVVERLKQNGGQATMTPVR
jgi:hypothetical protein